MKPTQIYIHLFQCCHFHIEGFEHPLNHLMGLHMLAIHRRSQVQTLSVIQKEIT